MTKYEMMFIVKSSTDEANVKKIAGEIEKTAKENKAKVSNFKELGLKKLAYPIKKEINGYYYVMNFEISINENILRHLIIKEGE